MSDALDRIGELVPARDLGIDGGELSPACCRVHRAGGAVPIRLRGIDRVDVRRDVASDPTFGPSVVPRARTMR